MLSSGHLHLESGLNHRIHQKSEPPSSLGVFEPQFKLKTTIKTSKVIIAALTLLFHEHKWIKNDLHKHIPILKFILGSIFLPKYLFSSRCLPFYLPRSIDLLHFLCTLPIALMVYRLLTLSMLIS